MTEQSRVTCPECAEGEQTQCAYCARWWYMSAAASADAEARIEALEEALDFYATCDSEAFAFDGGSIARLAVLADSPQQEME